MVGATLMTTWGKNENKSALRKLFGGIICSFPHLAEGLFCFSETTVKWLPAATEAEVKQVMLVQFK